MLNISVDLGSYSVKLLTFVIEKKKIKYISNHEVVIEQSDDINNYEDRALKIVHDYLQNIEEEFNLYVISPSTILTSRILSLPVNNRKKASQMLPFQLESDLPYSLSHAHFTSSIDIGKKTSRALVNISKKDDFDQFFGKINEYKMTPKVLTSDISSLEAFIKSNSDIDHQVYCILDIGHTTTKGYFFSKNNLVSSHTSFIAGRTINEAICQQYKISINEASSYKHKNAFVLTDSQKDSVNKDQKHFADLMHNTLAPLINEFKRWDVGFRVKYGIQIEHIYITGGSSNIKNIEHYLAQQLQVKVSHLDSYINVNANALNNNNEFRNNFSNANILSQASMTKSRLANLLSGNYAIGTTNSFPIHTLGFVGIRAASLFLIIMISVIVQRVAINNEIKDVNVKASKLLKNPTLGINKKLRRKFKRNPKVVQKKINRKLKEIKQEVKLVQSAVNTNSIASLELLANLVGGTDFELRSFQALSQGDFVAIFSIKNEKEAKELSNIFKSSNITNLSTDIDLENKRFKVSGSDNL
ncbi:MAG: pilus assembly protein PilM [Bacteriovoracaceae bacterium]|jgi:Tfp pilus assembly PilM family ATPase|nr:pilus assembly protein PilM [Bacteriovoracaceae bacterium]